MTTDVETRNDLVAEAKAGVDEAQAHLADIRGRFVTGDTTVTSVDVLRAEETLEQRRTSLKRARKLDEQLEAERQAYAAQREQEIQQQTAAARTSMNAAAHEVRSSYDEFAIALERFLGSAAAYREVLGNILTQAEAGGVELRRLSLPDQRQLSHQPLGSMSEGRLIGRALKEAAGDRSRMFGPDRVMTELLHAVGGLVPASVPLEAMLPPITSAPPPTTSGSAGDALAATSESKTGEPSKSIPVDREQPAIDATSSTRPPKHAPLIYPDR